MILKLFLSIKDLNPNNSYALIKRDLRNLCLWALNNDLQFNHNKCALLYRQNNPLFTYTLGNHIINAVQSVTDLVVLRNLDLSYKEHCYNPITYLHTFYAVLFAVTLNYCLISL